MPDVLSGVLGALRAQLAPAAVAIGPGNQALEDVVFAALEGSDTRVDLVKGPSEVASDVTLVVAPLGDASPWDGVTQAMTLYVGENAIALDGPPVADTAALLDDYGNLRIEALEDSLREQAEEIATLRARLARQGATNAALELAHATPAHATDPVAEKRERAAAQRFADGYDPETMLAALGWEDANPAALGGPLPLDRRPPGTPSETVLVSAGDSARALLRTCWSVLGRATVPVALDLAVEETAQVEVQRVAAAVATLGPDIRVIGADEAEEGKVSLRIDAGDLVPAGWPAQPEPPRSVAFVLPGAPPGGSGGSHSVVQEVLGLIGLGVDTTLVVPSSSRTRIEATYPEIIPALRHHSDDAELVGLVSSTEVVVATEHTSVEGVVAATRQTGALPAYYVQDYEAFFAPEESGRGDAAILSYRADPALRLFAKTHWLANLVTALHGVQVELVTPSIDRRLYHREGRRPAADGEPVRVSAMIRPRTPRRRPAATLRLLAALRKQLGEGVEVVTFGCAPEELAALAGGSPPTWEHRGFLRRHQVADLLRNSDVFIDLSIYQAFGRTGCEAMASGAVPVLPPIGGVSQYATDGVDSLLVDGEDGDRALAAVLKLVGDRDRMVELGEAGGAAVGALSIEAAAQSWAAALGAALATRRAAASS